MQDSVKAGGNEQIVNLKREVTIVHGVSSLPQLWCVIVFPYQHTWNFSVGLDIDSIKYPKEIISILVILIAIGYHICFPWDVLGLEEQIRTVDTQGKGICTTDFAVAACM